MTFLWIIVAAVLGGFVAEMEGLVFGAFLGFLLARLLRLQNRVDQLESRFRSRGSAHDRPAQRDPIEEPPRPAPDATATPIPEVDPEAAAEPARAYTIAETIARQAKVKGLPVRGKKARPAFKLPDSKLLDFLLRGNPIAKTAIVVLFFGVAFLFKYAADRNIIPIEWRLAGIALAATGLLLWGLKLRHKQKLYALIIQGGALGILYLTVFAAAKFYSVLPLPVALIIMVGLVALSGFLSIWQDSKSLAVFSTIGGFLAPVLTATNTGNHVQLFSYYAVLNLGILGISWFKAWRLLIWLGFVFTFVIGATWGYFDYREELFSSTEPFLLFFFLLYLCIPVLYLRKQDDETRGMLDGSVVFGLPTISFALQYQMVEGRFDNGDAWSALAWGLVYLAAAGLMRWRPLPGSQSLRISYTAIAAVFLTVTVFFAFSKDVTSVFWALEGVGLMLLGCRQRQFLPRAAGIALQVLAGVIFAEHYGRVYGSTLMLNTQFFVLAMISLAVLANGYLLHKNRDRLFAIESLTSAALLVVALAIWYVGGTLEVIWYLQRPGTALSLIILYSATVLACLFAGRQLDWPLLAGSALVIFLTGTLLLLGNFADNSYVQPMVGLGWLAYPLMLAVMALVLRHLDTQTGKDWRAVFHFVAVLDVVCLFGWIVAAGISNVAGDRDWYPIMWGLTALLSLLALLFCRHSNSWPVRQNQRVYKEILPVLFAAASSLWILASSWQLIQPHDWKYIPVLNPLDIVHIAGFWILSAWALDTSTLRNPKHVFFQYLFPFLVFIWINSLVAKAVHYWAGVRFDADALLAYPMFQAATSVLWSMLALLFVTLSRKKLSRKLWLIGIILLGAVVLKLAFFDLVDSGTLGRIISFLAVGVLMLVIGYIAPMPPKAEADAN